jgi:MscS family membrane protein
LPAHTLYFARDDGLDATRAGAAEAQVRNWRKEGRLPFPDFSPEQKNQIRGSLVYPHAGSPEVTPKANQDPPAPGGARDQPHH